MNKRCLFGLFVLVLSLSLVQCEPGDIFPSDPTSKISGQWSCSEDSELFGISTYQVTITRSGNVQEILLTGFYNLTGRSVRATVDGQEIIIPSQTVDGNTISGNGTIAKDFSDIEFFFDVDDHSGVIDHVSATLTK